MGELLNKALLRSDPGEQGHSDEEPCFQSATEGPLTTYVRQLGDTLQPVSGPVFERFWHAFRQSLKQDLHRRGLWESPPRFVGIEAGDAWNEEALEELATEGYLFLMQRIRALHQHLKLKPNIDGLVRLNIRHFLYERQKRADPLGFRIFDITRYAVRQATASGDLRVVAGDPRIENSTLLEPSGSLASKNAPEPGTRLEDRCRGFADALMPDLLLANGKRRLAVADRLAESLATLSRREVGTLSFKTLVDGLKAAVRVRWRAVFVHEYGGEPSDKEVRPDRDFRARPAVPDRAAVLPRVDFEDEESFRALTRAVSRAVEAAPASNQHRRYLPRLWEFLRTSSADPGTAAIPSRRRVAELLEIPRYLLPQLYGQLGEIVDRCQRTTAVEPMRRQQSGRGA